MRPIEIQTAQLRRATDRVAAAEPLHPAAKVGEGQKDVEVKLTSLHNNAPAPLDAERVEQIRHAIATGTYSLEPTKIADAMIEAAATLRKFQ